MQLCLKTIQLSAGRPVVILSSNLANKLDIHTDERLIIKKDSYKTIAVVDITQALLLEGEIAVSSEVLANLHAKENDCVEIAPAPNPESLSYIQKKLNCKSLEKKEIFTIIQDVVNNALTEAEIAYFISAVYKCGMSLRETADMTQALVKTGKTLGLSKKLIADKHSIGGIAGNRTTPIVVSICSSAGLTMPKTSSRAITSAAGTADTMETLCKVDFSIPELRKILEKVNACMVWGGAIGLAPGDDKLIQVERLLNLDPEPQLLASIIAKKLAIGSKFILIDIPYGKSAKVTRNEALLLEKKFYALSKYFKLKIQCTLTKGSQPIGNGIGPVLEMKDVLSVLTQENSVKDIETRSIELSGKLLEMCGKARKNTGEILARKILDSGDAFDKFKEIIKAQKGSLKRLKAAKYISGISSEKSGIITEIDNRKINQLARIAGSPIEKLAGIYLYKHAREHVRKNERILDIHAESHQKLADAVKFYRILKPITVV